MAAVVTNYGNQNYGGGTVTGLTTVTGQILFPPQNPPNDAAGNARAALAFQACNDRLDSKLVIIVVGTQAFNLDYQFSPDQASPGTQDNSLPARR
jgi:hypothetical protein